MILVQGIDMSKHLSRLDVRIRGPKGCKMIIYPVPGHVGCQEVHSCPLILVYRSDQGELPLGWTGFQAVGRRQPIRSQTKEL